MYSMHSDPMLCIVRKKCSSCVSVDCLQLYSKLVRQDLLCVDTLYQQRLTIRAGHIAHVTSVPFHLSKLPYSLFASCRRYNFKVISILIYKHLDSCKEMLDVFMDCH